MRNVDKLIDDSWQRDSVQSFWIHSENLDSNDFVWKDIEACKL